MFFFYILLFKGGVLQFSIIGPKVQLAERLVGNLVFKKFNLKNFQKIQLNFSVLKFYFI